MRAASLVLLVVAGCAGRPLAPVIPPPVPAPRVVADLHLHVSMSDMAKPVFKGEPGKGVTWDPSTILINQIDEDQLRATGVTLALGSVWPNFNARVGRTQLGEALQGLQALKAFTRRQPGFAFVLSADQARTALARGRIALFPTLEGGESIHEVADVDRLWNAGMRAITLVHFENIKIGGAAKGQIPKNLLGLSTKALEPMGLTPLGRAAVERMFDLGIVIDLAHASDTLANDVLAMAEERGVPVLNSHSVTRTFTPDERSLPDPVAQRIVKGGGIIGVVLNQAMAANTPESARWPGFVPNTCDEIVAHWLHFAKLVGPEHLVLGSDFNGFIPRHPPGGSCPRGIRNTGDLDQLWAALLAHGVPRAALDNMGDTFLALVDKVEAQAKPEARAAARQVERKTDPGPFDAP